jgi:hypothetical protein
MMKTLRSFKKVGSLDQHNITTHKPSVTPLQQTTIVFCLHFVNTQVLTAPEDRMSELLSADSELSAEDTSADESLPLLVFSYLLIWPCVSSVLKETALGTT